MEIREIIRSIRNIENSCSTPIKKKEDSSGQWEHQLEHTINYEKFYERVMGIVELADEITRPRGGTYG